MKSKDVKALTREELAQKFNEALKTEDPEQVAQAMADMADGIQNEILERAQSMANVEQLDAQALASRGLRQLTSAEKKFYEKVIDAMKSEDPKQALAHLDVTMPETIIEDVFEDLRREHKLLAAINFQNTTYVTEWILNKNGKQKAVWGAITATITKELEGEFEKLNMTMFSLTAFLPVAKSMLDLGATWLDSYVREVLKDALYCGLEEAIVCGTGVDMPIGMMKNLEASKQDGEAYPDKEAIIITRFDAQQYGGVIAKLATSRNGRPREVGSVIMVVNPVDYFNKVMPATTIQRPDEHMQTTCFHIRQQSFSRKKYQQAKQLSELQKSISGMGTSKDGVIEYDDSYKFYSAKSVRAFLYGNGKPVDNNSFVVLDISTLEPMVYIVGTATAAAAVASNETVEVEKTSWTEEELNAMTVAQIEGLAAYMKYEISGSTKDEKIASFIEAQTAAQA